MTWTPADGPSRVDLEAEAAKEPSDVSDGFSGEEYFGLIRCALAVHDLYEENQRLKAELQRVSGTPNTLANDIVASVRVIARLETELAEAKRDTERLDWLEDHLATAIGSTIDLQEGVWLQPASGSLRATLDDAMRTPPTPETKG